MHTLALVGGILRARRECLPHVLVALIFLVDQMIGRRDMVVSVRLKASDTVLLLELEIID